MATEKPDCPYRLTFDFTAPGLKGEPSDYVKRNLPYAAYFAKAEWFDPNSEPGKTVLHFKERPTEQTLLKVLELLTNARVSLN